MAKKNNTFLVLAVLIGVILLFLFLLPKDTKTNDFIEAQFYDKDGNKIFDTSEFAIVTTGGEEVHGVAFMDFTINVENTGETPITLSFDSVTPTVFSSALTQTSKTLEVGEITSWQTSLIDVEQFVPGSQTFYVNLKGIYQDTIIYRQASITLGFASDLVTDFVVELEDSTGGTSPSLYCGDGTCQGEETSSTCPDDCGTGSSTYELGCVPYGILTVGSNTEKCIAGGYDGSGIIDNLPPPSCLSVEIVCWREIGSNIFSSVCGNGLCESDETVSSCPADCGGTTGSVIFRTSDLSYSSGWFAFDKDGDGVLEGYGYESYQRPTYECENHILWNQNPTPLLFNLPGSLDVGGDGNIKLYQDNTDDSEIHICENDLDGDGCTTRRYDSVDSDADDAVLSSEPQAGYEDKEM